MKFRSAFFLVLLFALPNGLFGQNKTAPDSIPNLEKIILNRLYMDTLSRVFDQVALDTKIEFVFDRNKLGKVYVQEMALNTPLPVFLNKICKNNKLKWYQDESGKVVIKGVNESVNTNTVRNNQVKKYTGPPSRTNFTLTGTVKDLLNGESLPFVPISVAGTGIGTTSNIDGYFTIQHVPCDTSTLVVNYMGYGITRIHLDPDLASRALIIELSPTTVMKKEVVISADREDILQSQDGLSTIKMSPRMLSSLPSLGEKDMMRTFQLMPGISAANESSSGLYVRGGTPDQNLILYDGFNVYQVDHLYGFFSAFNSNAIKDVQLYKGGFESRFGGRLSSVTEITGKEGNSNHFSAGADVSLLSFNAFAETPIGKKMTFLVAGRRSYKGPIYNTIFDKFNTNSDPVPASGNGNLNFDTKVSSYFYDLNGKLTFRPNEKDIFSLSVFNGTDKLDNGTVLKAPSMLASQGIDFNFTISDLTRYGNFGSSLRWSRRWNERLYSNTILSYSNYYSLRDRSNSGEITDSNGEKTSFSFGTKENNDLKDVSFRSDLTLEAGRANKIEFGFFSTYYDILYTYTQNDTTTILNRYNYGGLAGIYIQDKIDLFEGRIKIIPGVRSTYYQPTGKNYFEPRASLSVSLSPELKFNASWGRYYQFANRVIREDILSGSRDFWVLSDDDKVPVSNAYHYIAGLQYETSGFVIAAEAYYKTLEGLSEYSLRYKVDPFSINYDENFFSGIGYSKGLEFLLQKKTGKFTGWVSYTLAETRYQFDVYGENWFAAAQDVTNEFKIVGLYKWNKWTFSASWVYATGRPYTAPEGGYQITLLDGSTQDFITAGAKNGRRLPDYHRMDIAATWRFGKLQDGSERGNMSFSLFNLYNHTNVWYKEYQIVSNELVSTDHNYLGITPNVTLTFKIR